MFVAFTSRAKGDHFGPPWYRRSWQFHRCEWKKEQIWKWAKANSFYILLFYHLKNGLERLPVDGQRIFPKMVSTKFNKFAGAKSG